MTLLELKEAIHSMQKSKS